MKLNKNLLLSPDPADGGSVGTAEAGTQERGQAEINTDVLETQQEGAGEQQGQQQQQTTTETTTEQTGAGTQTTTQQSGISKEDLQAILQEVIPAIQPQQQQRQEQQPRQYTQQEYDQMFNVWQPSEALLTQLRSDDPKEAIKAFVQIRDGLIKQAMTMAEYRIQQFNDSIVKEHIEPIRGYVTEQQARSFRDDFFKTNPDLEPYETIVDAVATKLQAAGWTGKNRTEVMKRFADDTKAVVKELLAKAPGAAGAAAGANGKTGTVQQNGKGKMSTLTGGGQGGTSRPGAATASKGPAGIEIFD